MTILYVRLDGVKQHPTQLQVHSIPQDSLARECVCLFTPVHVCACERKLESVSHMTYDTAWLTLKVLVATIDAQWEGMGDVGSARYEPAILPPCPTIRVLSYVQ